MKNLILLFLLSSTFAVLAQEKKSTEKSKWIIGFGTNIIDNTSTKNNQYLYASKQWNYMPTVSKVSFERILSEQFSIESTLSINKLSSQIMQNGGTLTEDKNYVGLDLNGKFYFGKALYKCPAIDPYIVAGFGINKVGDNTNQTPNYGLGLNLWFNSTIGLRLQTIGKYGIIQRTLLNNHIQHSAELVLKF
jgi:hypothetical protein